MTFPSCFGIVLTAVTCLPAPGGTRIDDSDKTKMTNHCVFSANEDHETIRNYAQVEPGMQSGDRSPQTDMKGEEPLNNSARQLSCVWKNTVASLASTNILEDPIPLPHLQFSRCPL